MAKKKAKRNKNREAWRAAHRGHAHISWTAPDVLDVAPKNWTVEMAEQFLVENGRRLQERLCQLGYEVIENLIAEEEVD
jgi:hypothetical protein